MTLCGIGLQDTWMFEETVRENVHIIRVNRTVRTGAISLSIPL